MADERLQHARCYVRKSDRLRARLYPFVAVTNGTAPGSAPGDGGQDMAFFNMETGDAPIFKALADQYAISDNFHQAIMGGSVTGHFGIVYGDNPFFANPDDTPGTPTGGITNQIRRWVHLTPMCRTGPG